MKSSRKMETSLRLLGIGLLLTLSTACTDELMNEIPLGNTVGSEPVPVLFLDPAQTAIMTEDGQRIIVEGDRSVQPGQRTKIREYRSGRRFLCVEGHKKCWQIL